MQPTNQQQLSTQDHFGLIPGFFCAFPLVGFFCCFFLLSSSSSSLGVFTSDAELSLGSVAFLRRIRGISEFNYPRRTVLIKCRDLIRGQDYILPMAFEIRYKQNPTKKLVKFRLFSIQLETLKKKKNKKKHFLKENFKLQLQHVNLISREYIP